MNTSINVHGGRNQRVELKPGFAKTADAFWISLNVADGNGDNHDTTFFVPADDYARFARAANAFNAALNEPAVADALAAPTLIAAE